MDLEFVVVDVYYEVVFREDMFEVELDDNFLGVGCDFVFIG